MATAKGSKCSSAGRSTLRTEKQGRMFAVRFLEQIAALEDNDLRAAYPFASVYDHGEEVSPFRKGPQWDGVYKGLQTVQGMSDEALRGFSSIMTDALGQNSSEYMTDEFRRLEREGMFLPFGTPGTKYPKPRTLTKKETAARRIEGEKERERYNARYAKERKQKEEARYALPSEFAIGRDQPEAVEAFLTSGGQARRVALAFLTRPYAEMARKIKADKKTAEAFAAVCRYLQSNCQNYSTLNRYVHGGLWNIRAAILARKDGKKLLGKVQER